MPRGFGDQDEDDFAREMATQVGTPELVEQLAERAAAALDESDQPLTPAELAPCLALAADEASILLDLLVLRGVATREVTVRCARCGNDQIVDSPQLPAPYLACSACGQLVAIDPASARYRR